jgi:hypothetical protein
LLDLRDDRLSAPDRPARRFPASVGRGRRSPSYRFGTGAADHLFCSVCGVKSFYQPRSHPEAWSVNVNALDDASALTITVRAFDGRNAGGTLGKGGGAASSD